MTEYHTANEEFKLQHWRFYSNILLTAKQKVEFMNTIKDFKGNE